jgi:hypothetical protein
MERHFIRMDTGDIAPNEENPAIALMEPATPEQVAEMLATPIGENEGRSEWVWVRLRDGTLMLAILPLGDTYMYHTDVNNAAHW